MALTVLGRRPAVKLLLPPPPVRVQIRKALLTLGIAVSHSADTPTDCRACQRRQDHDCCCEIAVILLDARVEAVLGLGAERQKGQQGAMHRMRSIDRAACQCLQNDGKCGENNIDQEEDKEEERCVQRRMPGEQKIMCASPPGGRQSHPNAGLSADP